MKKVCLILLLCCLVVACGGAKKPPLSPTQIVDGKSIIIPPEFDIVPEEEVTQSDLKQ